MKSACFFLLVSMSVAAKTPAVVIACDPADAEHCKMTSIEGRQVRELVHDGTSVAVGKPVRTSDGDYRVFVRVTQVGPGKAEIRPKDFSALFSDPAHTRFGFYDMAAEINQRIREANRAQQPDQGDELDTLSRHAGSRTAQSTGGTSKAAKLGRLRKPDPNEVAGREDEATGSRQSAQQAGTTITPEELYLSRSTLRRGDFAEGFVYFKRPRRSKVHGGPDDPLHEIDIPVNGVVFRFD